MIIKSNHVFSKRILEILKINIGHMEPKLISLSLKYRKIRNYKKDFS